MNTACGRPGRKKRQCLWSGWFKESVPPPHRGNDGGSILPNGYCWPFLASEAVDDTEKDCVARRLVTSVSVWIASQRDGGKCVPCFCWVLRLGVLRVSHVELDIFFRLNTKIEPTSPCSFHFGFAVWEFATFQNKNTRWWSTFRRQKRKSNTGSTYYLEYVYIYIY